MSILEIRVAPIQGLPSSAEIIINGPVGSSDAKTLKDTLDKQVAARVAYVSILMKQVSYMNSAGLACLIEVSATLERRGGTLVLVEVQPKVKVVLSNLGMNRYFRFEAIDEDARAFLRAQAERVARTPRIVPADGPDAGVAFPVTAAAPIRIGSDAKSTIVVRHADAERAHAEVCVEGDRCCVKDLGSRTGTFVGDRKVANEPLKAGDVVRVATLKLAFYPPGAPAR
jgi:anti-anti-sigma factor